VTFTDTGAEMIELDRKILIELWNSGDTVEEIADRYECQRRDILNAWRKLKSAGHMPTGDRPRSRQSNHRGDGNHDGRPRDSGDMLDALNRYHIIDNDGTIRERT
jgi:hypothetical protein